MYDELTLFCSFMANYDLYWYWSEEWAILSGAPKPHLKPWLLRQTMVLPIFWR